MLEDFREEANKGNGFLEEIAETDNYLFDEPPRPKENLLGMSPIQRLIIALMLLMVACTLSTFCLLITQKIALPFL
jgi:hypothetical protein